MKYKGLILVILIAIAVAALLFLPEGRIYKEIAAVNAPAPDFELLDSNLNPWKLSDLRDKVVFVSFWATWCTVCKSEIPSKESLNKKMQDRPFQMLGILYRDDPLKAAAYIRKYGITVPTLISPNNEVAGLYGITGVPESFIIDKDGIIREKIVGPREWDSPANVALIEKWL